MRRGNERYVNSLSLCISTHRRFFTRTNTGVLACLDGFMNIVMEQTEEYVDGQLVNKYGECFIRGNNVLYISAQSSKRRR